MSKLIACLYVFINSLIKKTKNINLTKAQPEILFSKFGVSILRWVHLCLCLHYYSNLCCKTAAAALLFEVCGSERDEAAATEAVLWPLTTVGWFDPRKSLGLGCPEAGVHNDNWGNCWPPGVIDDHEVEVVEAAVEVGLEW